MQYISVKKRSVLQQSKLFFSRTLFKYYKLDLVKKKNSSSFLVHSQSSIELREFFITNSIRLLLSDYTVYGIFF